MKLLSQLRTSKQLGWRNCAAVVLHRLALRTGMYERQLPLGLCPIPEPLSGQPQPIPFSGDSWLETSHDVCLAAADALLAGTAIWFSHESYAVGSPPDWFLDPSSGQRFQNGLQHWTRCRPFAGADVKRCWELSRWGWAQLLIRAWRITGNPRYRVGFNSWSESWCTANPVNGGYNWLCGQEASIRLIHALQAWQLADAPAQLPHLSPNRVAFVEAHLHRIAATKNYAQAQDNNHWTSEAAAMFIAGSWLASSTGANSASSRRWASEGRRALESSIARLVLADGSFAQHSLTYHRLLLDTLSQVELWRRWLDLPHFSILFRERCCAATHWFAALLDPISGDGPNLGSNDGAFCYQLHSQSYRDFRPTLQLASVLFTGLPCLAPGPWNEPLHWFGLIELIAEGVNDLLPEKSDVFSTKPLPAIELLLDGGYALLRPTFQTWALLRLPVYRFRPCHADPLHLDLWHQGVNLLRDGGSYAYNTDTEDLGYFPGISSHNSVQFDGAEPMPRLGRFLWGDWLQLESPPQLGSSSVTAAYKCNNGRHQRQVEINSSGQCWKITDTCTGFQSEALLRWRLSPGYWRLDSSSLIGDLAIIQVDCDQPITRFELLSNWESLEYGCKTLLPVLEVRVAQAPAIFTTTIHLRA